MNRRLPISLLIAVAASACSGGTYKNSNPQYSGNQYSGNSYANTSETTGASPTAAGTTEAAPVVADAPEAAPAGAGTSLGRSHNGDASSQALARRRAARERPGLGTVFGETVSSYVRMRPFVRATAGPFATVSMHYNDSSGVQAHLGYLSNERLAPFRAHTPHGGITVALTDEYGNELPGGMAKGRALIVGAEGQRYKLVLSNQTGGRFEVVASVDGLDVIDGRPADLHKRGYVLEPHQTLVIDGFRRNEYEVAAFRFGRVRESYAARTSGDRNVGVVGVAVFAERGSVWTTDELQRRDTANPFPGDRRYAPPPSY